MTIRPYFILSCARSGSTSLAHILDLAENGHCACEPMPNLNVETRLAMDGKLNNEQKQQLIKEQIVPRVNAGKEKHGIYGEKNLTYGPFVTELFSQTKGIFIHLIRDGRDVVTSLVNWHRHMFGDIYRECKDDEPLTPRAISILSNLDIYQDTSDYSRPRPKKADYNFLGWHDYSRLQMCAYYWSKINLLYLENLSNIPRENQVAVNYTGINNKRIEELYQKLGLQVKSSNSISEQLNRKINSVKQRANETPSFPKWTNWSSTQRKQFKSIANKAMIQFGYATNQLDFWKPDSFCGEKSIEALSDPRRYAQNYLNDNLDKFLSVINLKEKNISVSELGSKSTANFKHYFLKYKHINYMCLGAYDNASNLININSTNQFDIVIANGIIDSTYDIDLLLEQIVSISNGYIYLTTFSGWNNGLSDHGYQYINEGFFSIKVSVELIIQKLSQLGCIDMLASQLYIDARNSIEATIITAKVS